LIEDHKSGCGYTYTAKGVDHERCVMVVKTEYVIDAKMCMSQRRITETVIVVEKKMYFLMKTLRIK